jgi:uncharacterized membrane protein SpoIIM required for sporulation
MNIDQFVSERKKEWEDLDRIARKIRPGQPSRLSRKDLWDLGRLYSGAISDLSLLKASPLAADPDNPLIAYVNELVIRVHGTIYGKPPLRWSSLAEYVTEGFPRVFWESGYYICVSTAIFVLFGLAGFVFALAEPAFIELLVPEHIISTAEKGGVWFKSLFGMAPMGSSLIMTNNISVTFTAFAAGLTFGIGTVYLLALNGLLLGTVAALCFTHNLSLEFWSFVIPHGSLELTAIFIAGGGGLVLGHALLDPGPYRRGEYLAVRGKQVVSLVIGCVPLLVVAGIIEAFFSPSPAPAWLKIMVGTMLFFGLMTLLFLAQLRLKAGRPWKTTATIRR